MKSKIHYIDHRVLIRDRGLKSLLNLLSLGIFYWSFHHPYIYIYIHTLYIYTNNMYSTPYLTRGLSDQSSLRRRLRDSELRIWYRRGQIGMLKVSVWMDSEAPSTGVHLELGERLCLLFVYVHIIDWRCIENWDWEYNSPKESIHPLFMYIFIAT